MICSKKVSKVKQKKNSEGYKPMLAFYLHRLGKRNFKKEENRQKNKII